MDNRLFDRSALSKAETKLLRDGRIANAVVTRVTIDGARWTVKDFAARPWYVRWTVAPVLLRHELSILKRLSGVDGIAARAFRIDRNGINFITVIISNTISRERITPEFLCAFEALLDAVHARGVVHLDARGTGNVMIRPDGSPGLIDFQASLTTGWMPGGLRRLLEDIDRSGALKKWAAYRPEEMGEERVRELERINRLRRFWVFRGYFGLKKNHAAKRR